MKNILAIIFAVSALAACGSEERNGLDVTDRSFEFGLSVNFNDEKLCHVVALELLSGNPEAGYVMTYSLDGNASSEISDDRGTIPNGSAIDFGNTQVRLFSLPELSEGRHLFAAKIAADGYCQNLEIEFNVAADEAYAGRFSFAAEVNTSLEGGSVLLVSLNKGDAEKEYVLSYDIDGIEGLKINDMDGNEVSRTSSVCFPASGLLTFTLPVLRPEEHTITVNITDNNHTQNACVDFTEPMRFPEIEIIFDSDGEYINCYARSNPYDAEVIIEMTVEMTGFCNYTDQYGDFCSDSVTEKNSETVRSVLDRTNRTSIVDLGALRDRIVTKSQTSYREQWNSAGDGFWEYVPDRNAYYRVNTVKITYTCTVLSPEGLEVKASEHYRECPEDYWFAAMLK